MPLVVKSDPDLEFSKAGHRKLFVLPIRKGTDAQMADEVALFSSEIYGGVGLYALGKVTGLSNLGHPNVEITEIGPATKLGKSDFSKLDKNATAEPIEKLNQLLYIHSHNKVAEIDDATFQYIAQKFI